MKPKVIIIGVGYTGRLAIARSVGQLGYRSVIITAADFSVGGKRLKHVKPVDGYSKYVDEIFYVPRKDEAKIIEVLLTHCVVPGQKQIIFPDGDFDAMVLDKNYDILKEHFLMPNIKGQSGLVSKYMDKLVQKSVARQVGLNVAGSSTMEVRDEQFVVPDSVRYPCFVKAQMGLAGGKRLLKRCDSREQVEQHLRAMIRRMKDIHVSTDITVLIEDFMRIDKEYALLGFSDGKEVFIPGLLYIDLLCHGLQMGVAVRGKIMPCHGFEDVVEKFKQMMLEVGYVGVFDIDFYESEGKIYFGEINLRFGGSGYAYTAMGVNLPGMMVKHLMGEDWHSLANVVTRTETYINERTLMEDWRQGVISTAKYHEILKSGEIYFVHNADDPQPAKALRKLYRVNYLKRFVKKLLRKI